MSSLRPLPQFLAAQIAFDFLNEPALERCETFVREDDFYAADDPPARELPEGKVVRILVELVRDPDLDTAPDGSA